MTLPLTLSDILAARRAIAGAAVRTPLVPSPHLSEAAGAEVLHEPKVWPEYHESYYGVFVRDPDGNNVEAVCHRPE